jgi:L-ascorbate metabolism protein UlaG (beta-lactamase superfamily)
MLPLGAFLHCGCVLETPLEGIFFAPIDTTVPPRDAAKPRKPQPAKDLFREQRREDLVATHAGMATDAMNRLINEEWARLNEAAKAPFQAPVRRHCAALECVAAQRAPKPNPALAPD